MISIMTMNKKLTAIIIAALTLTASASDDRKDSKKELTPAAKVLKKIKAADKHEAKVGGKRKLSPAMAKFDKNKDGKLCEVERKAAKAAFMKRFDKNKDGKLDEKERKAAMAERRKNAKKSKDKGNGKGKLPKGAKGKKKPAPKK